MTTLYLIRHGETVWNVEGRIQGHRDSALNARGQAQAEQLGAALAEQSFEAIYASDLGRAADTARAVAAPHGLAPIFDVRLREVYFGEWEGLTLDEIHTRWPEALAAWRADSLRTRPPGGETLEQLQQRVASLLHDVTARHPDGTVALVGHGGSIKAAISLALGGALSVMRHIHLDNCSVSLAHLSPERTKLIRLNDIGHLPSRAAGGLDESGLGK